MKRVTFTASYPPSLAHPMHRELSVVDGVSRAELLMWGPTETVTTLLWCDGPPTAVRELLSAVESVESTTLVAASDGTYAFVAQREYELAEAVLDLVAEARLIFLPPVVFREDGTVRFEAAGESAALSEFYAGLSRIIETNIERVQPYRRQGSSARLTDRQRAALEAAVEVGYYAVPRTGDTDAVAAELDCEPSTAGELIRRAEAAVVSNAVDP